MIYKASGLIVEGLFYSDQVAIGTDFISSVG